MAKTEAAQAAQQIRKELKKHGIKASVKSSNFSMGSSVTVNVTDLLPATLEQVKIFAERYEYGTFNGMDDSQGVKNQDLDLPQAKYVNVRCEYSNEMRQSAWNFLKDKFSGFEEAPESASDAGSFLHKGFDVFGSELLHRVLNGSIEGFWTQHKPRQAA